MVEAATRDRLCRLGRRLAAATGWLTLAWMLFLLFCLAHGFWTGELLGFMPLELRTTLESWLGLGSLAEGSVRRWKIQAGIGEGTLLVALLLGLVALVVVSLRRRRQVQENRLGSGSRRRSLALLFLLLGLVPFWSVSVRRQELDTVVLLVDTSLSMNTVERTSGAPQSRWQSLQQALLSPVLDEVMEQHIIRLYTVGEAPRLVGTFSHRQKAAWRAAVQSLRPQETQSRLGDTLRQLLDTEQPAAIILCTDGLVTEGSRLQEAAALARTKRIPLVLLGVGQEAPPGRVRLKAVRASDQVQVHDVLILEADISAEGFPPGHRPLPVRISLGEKGQPQRLDEQTVTLDPQGALRTVRLRHQPQTAGEKVYEVRIDSPVPLSQAERVVQVLPQREINVLILEHQPRYETRFLAALWARPAEATTGKAAIQVRTRLLELEEEETAPSALLPRPTSLDLKQMQVVVMGDADPQKLSLADQLALKDFVQRQGGSLLLLAGPRFLPEAWQQPTLQELLPVERSPRPVTAPLEPGWPLLVSWLPRARRHPLLRPLLEAGEPTLEPLRWVASGWQARPTAEVLALATPASSPTTGPRLDGVPLLVLGRSGKGRCLFVATEETWRWRAFGGTDWHERFWLHLLRYLAEEPARHAVLHCAQPLPLRLGEPVRIEAQFSGDTAGMETGERLLLVEWQPFQRRGSQEPAETRTASLQEMPERPGTFVWEEKAARPGSYRFRLLAPRVTPMPTLEVSIAPPPDEQTPAAPDLEGMQEAARAAEGHCLHLREVARLPSLLPVETAAGSGAPVEVALWNHPLLYLPLLLFLFAEWLRQRWREEG
jgi:hypothetical protein